MTEMDTDGPVTKNRRQAQVVLCVGCCCGRVDRGKPEVPVDMLKAAWKEHGLRRIVQLPVSGCLGPCDLHNVVLLMTEHGQTWLGGLERTADFEPLIDWARAVVEHGPQAPLPESLARYRFERWNADATELTSTP